MATVVMNADAVHDLTHGDTAHDILEGYGERITARAKALAPVLTGVGRASLHYEFGTAAGDLCVRIGWGPEAYYLKYNELGTSRQPARPFLRPAAYGG